IVLGGHGLFTWGDSPRECYRNTLAIIDQLGQFVVEHVEKLSGKLFGGPLVETRPDQSEIALSIFPYIRGRVSAQKRLIGTFTGSEEVLRFVNSRDAERLAYLGTSCPDHFVRTKIRPLHVPWNPSENVESLRSKIDAALEGYRRDYEAYYRQFADSSSPALRDPNPTVVLVPGLGMFSFGKNKTESRITGEFYVNAIHVMEGASSLQSGSPPATLPQSGPAAGTSQFQVHSNYVALPLSEAFRIEYWALEEAKLRRQPPEKELSRQIALVVGGGSGIGREVARLACERGAHVIIADRDLEAANQSLREASPAAGKESVMALPIDITNREAIQQAIRQTVSRYGGIDILVNTAALFPSSPDGRISDAQWASTLAINVTANHLLVDEAAKIFADENLDASIVLTSSANAVVAKRGSEAYDVSKAAVSHLIREMAVSLAPKVRVNGISPATVVKGSTMFPRDRVIASLTKYNIAFDPAATDDELRNLLAGFYAKRTLTHQPIDPVDCANAILFLAGPQARCTSGHLIPVDGGLVEAFLR
ncbi:MAG TPA: bifunctional rhamnulose-1-phosphate aldolase/short-chain dehydrogenase, partial [Acidobacteriaceae bacterium]|nr:bifunctional rhamnulose-1-phosphate aldolase/short-chain dehydrogenase [Acidobacteriaceae bacterium]